MSPSTRALNESLLRLAKGAVSAWETWLRAQAYGTEACADRPEREVVSLRR